MARHLSTGDAPQRRSSTPRASARATARPVTVGATTRRVSSRTARRTASGGSVRASGRGTALGPSRGGKGLLVALAAVAVAVVLAVAFLAVSCSRGGTPDEGGDAGGTQQGAMVELQIPEGAGGDQIAQAVVAAGLAPDAKTFYATVTKLKADTSLKPGTYEFPRGTSLETVVTQLTKGPNSDKGRLTVAEGLTVAQTAEAVEKALGIPKDDFLAQAKASAYVDDYPFLAPAADDSLEGFLWGSTYDFTGKDVTADSVIRAMLDQYQAQTAKIDFDSARSALQASYGVQMSDYDILKLASVIEKEAVNESDRPLVSSVFYNRMRDGMPLQSDATMMYVTGGEVTAEDLKIESPYNSYLNRGLPPTPICTPSLECIEAALGPADTDYYYFLIIENGSYSNHTFSQTYDQHLAAIEKAKADQAQS